MGQFKIKKTHIKSKSGIFNGYMSEIVLSVCQFIISIAVSFVPEVASLLVYCSSNCVCMCLCMSLCVFALKKNLTILFCDLNL